jgi:hypothetical protein
MTDTAHRKKVNCGCCNRETYCYETEMRMYVFKDNAINIKTEDWCCLKCIYKLFNMVKGMKRTSMSPKEWLEKVTGMAYKDVIKELENEMPPNK